MQVMFPFNHLLKIFSAFALHVFSLQPVLIVM